MIGGDVTSPSVTHCFTIGKVTRNNMPLLSYTVSDGTVVVKLMALLSTRFPATALVALRWDAHTVRVESTRCSGNTGFAEINFTVDTTPPIVSIASPPPCPMITLRYFLILQVMERSLLGWAGLL